MTISKQQKTLDINRMDVQQLKLVVEMLLSLMTCESDRISVLQSRVLELEFILQKKFEHAN